VLSEALVASSGMGLNAVDSVMAAILPASAGRQLRAGLPVRWLT